MAANSDVAAVPTPFQRAAHDLLNAAWRPELAVEEIPAPQKIAPFAVAVSADVLVGGDGADIFLYSTTADSTVAARDKIYGFTAGVDKLNLSGIDADTTMAGNQAFHMVQPGMIFASPGDLEITSQGFNTIVQGDVNGDGVWDFSVQLVMSLGVTSADIVF